MTVAPTTGPRHRMPDLLHTLHGYRRQWLVPDLLAGLTLLAIAVPEQLATSRLAGMPPITGLYTFIAGTVAFAFLGSAPQLSVGADSTIAPLFAAGIAHIAPTGSAHYMALVSLLAVTVGVIVAVVGLLRMGWIADFLSAPIITGFLAGVTVIIIVHQLPDLFALPSVSGTTVHRVADVVRHLGQANGWALGIGVGVFAVVVAAERIDRKLPGALFGLVGSAIIVAAAGLRAHGVPVLGTVAHGAPHVGLHDLSFTSLGQVLPIAGVVALVVLSQTAATTRAFADQGGYPVDVNRDFVGVGTGSILAGLSGAFAANASPARTGAVASAGGRTQVAGLAAAAAVVLVVPAAGLLRDVPVATLAGILIFVATRLFHVGQLASVFRFDRWEFGLAIVTLLTVAFVGVEQGIGVAVGLAILDRTRRSARPAVTCSARSPARRVGNRSGARRGPRPWRAWSSCNGWRPSTTPTPRCSTPRCTKHWPAPPPRRRSSCSTPTPSPTSTTPAPGRCEPWSTSSSGPTSWWAWRAPWRRAPELRPQRTAPKDRPRPVLPDRRRSRDRPAPRGQDRLPARAPARARPEHEHEHLATHHQEWDCSLGTPNRRM